MQSQVPHRNGSLTACAPPPGREQTEASPHRPEPTEGPYPQRGPTDDLPLGEGAPHAAVNRHAAAVSHQEQRVLRHGGVTVRVGRLAPGLA
eukprot:CAMPEP_0182590638 /NCGR_PEP_ID=MMETSP1324-20130603/72062_1 /TAXON_ID=236786 /ORGANISM="Florenciella sp., Strain RCC1587" /LENGTH=90 /DNA_ID=CAMNT_0024807869 /DNA_START=115 /DNA_END=384 /DNA_ORIENTATION=+